MKMCKHHELSISMLHCDDPGIDLQLIRSQRLHRKHLDLDLKHEDCCNFWSCFCLYWYVCINLDVNKFMIFPSIVHACRTLRVILRNSLYFEILCMQHGYMHITSYRFGLVLFLLKCVSIVPISLPKILYNKLESVFIDISGSCSLCSGSGLPNQ